MNQVEETQAEKLEADAVTPKWQIPQKQRAKEVIKEKKQTQFIK